MIAEELKVVIRAEAQAALREMRRFGDEVASTKTRMQAFADTTGRLGQTLTRGLTLPIAGAGLAAVKFAADMERQQEAFSVLLGDVERGTQLFEDLKQFSAETPLQLQDITRASQTLLAFGTASEEVIERIGQLGDVAQGNAEKLDRITLAFGKIQARGKATMEEMNVLIEAGIPIIATLADNFGVAESAIFDMVSSGEVGIGDMEAALESMTGAGGQFEGMMERISQTTAGKFSTAVDNLKLAAADLGAEMLPMINDILERVTEWARAFTELDEETKKIILVMAGLAAAAGPTATAISGVTRAISFLIANPIVAGLALVAAGIVYLATTSKTYAEEVEELVDALEEQKTKADELLGPLSDINDQQVIGEEVYGRLITLYPELSGEIDAYTTSVEEAEKAVGRLHQQEFMRQAAPLVGQLMDARLAMNLYRREIAKAEEALETAEGMEARFRDTAIRGAREALREAQRQYEFFSGEAQMFEGQIQTLQNEFSRLFDDIDEGGREAAETIGGSGERGVAGALNQAAYEMNVLSEKSEQTQGVIETLNTSLSRTGDVLQGVETNTLSLVRALPRLEPSIDGVGDAISRLAGAAFGGALEEIVEVINELSRGFDDTNESANAAKMTLEELKTSMMSTTESARKLKEEMRLLAEALRNDPVSKGEQPLQTPGDVSLTNMLPDQEVMVQFETSLERVKSLTQETAKAASEITNNFAEADEELVRLAERLEAIAIDMVVDQFAQLGREIMGATEATGEWKSIMLDAASEALRAAALWAIPAGLRMIASGNVYGGLAILALGGIAGIGAGVMSVMSDNVAGDAADALRDLEDAADSLGDEFSQQYIKEEEEPITLRDILNDRIGDLRDVLDEEIAIRDEAMRELDREFAQEYAVLRDLWDRNLISTTEFQERISDLNESYDTQRNVLIEPVEDIRDKIDEIRDFLEGVVDGAPKEVGGPGGGGGDNVVVPGAPGVIVAGPGSSTTTVNINSVYSSGDLDEQLYQSSVRTRRRGRIPA